MKESEFAPPELPLGESASFDELSRLEGKATELLDTAAPDTIRTTSRYDCSIGDNFLIFQHESYRDMNPGDVDYSWEETTIRIGLGNPDNDALKVIYTHPDTVTMELGDVDEMEAASKFLRQLRSGEGLAYSKVLNSNEIEVIKVLQHIAYEDLNDWDPCAVAQPYIQTEDDEEVYIAELLQAEIERNRDYQIVQESYSFDVENQGATVRVERGGIDNDLYIAQPEIGALPALAITLQTEERPDPFYYRVSFDAVAQDMLPSVDPHDDDPYADKVAEFMRQSLLDVPEQKTILALQAALSAAYQKQAA